MYIYGSPDHLFLRVDTQLYKGMSLSYAEIIPVLRLGFTLRKDLSECFLRKGIVVEGFPEMQLQLLCFRHSFRSLYLFCPVIGAFHHIELGSRRGVVNFPELNLKKKKTYLLIRMLIEPLDSLTMFVARPLDNPDDNLGIFPGRIGDDLAQMIVVGIFKLIFNNNFSAGSFLTGINIRAEIPYRGLPFLKNNINADSIAQ